MGTSIHPTAIVDKECQVGEGSTIGPMCVLSGKVTLGARVSLIGHVNLHGPIEIGDDTTVYPGACLGFPAQDYKFKIGMPTAGVRIGKECLFREHVTVHAATKTDTPTRIGDKVFMMACSHAAHDASVGNGVIMVNSALLAGHAQIHDNAIMSGNTAIHQFGRIGRMAFLSGGVASPKDVPPFCVSGGRGLIHGLNLVGLRRNGTPRDQITLLRRAFWEVLRHNMPRNEMVARLEELGKECSLVQELAVFVRESKRGICIGAPDVSEEAELE